MAHVAPPQHPAQPRPPARRRGLKIAVIVVLVLALTGGAVVGAGYVLLTAFNPVADEWQCVEGEAPAGNRSGGSACFPEGSELPRGFSWDPFGNRPMSYNCDQDGWVQVEHRRRGELDCVREGTDLPPAWQVVRQP